MKSWHYPGDPVVKKPTWQCREHQVNPWSGRIPHAMEQPSPRHKVPAQPKITKDKRNWFFFKMKSLGRPYSNTTNTLTKRGNVHTGRPVCEHEGRDQGDASTSQGMPDCQQKLGEGQGTHPSHSPQNEPMPPTLWAWTSSQWDNTFLLCKPSKPWYPFTTAQANEHDDPTDIFSCGPTTGHCTQALGHWSCDSKRSYQFNRFMS